MAGRLKNPNRRRKKGGAEAEAEEGDKREGFWGEDEEYVATRWLRYSRIIFYLPVGF